ncbi:MAG: S8 family serine peptidase [Nitrososphaeraceae archaeon]
MKIYTSMPILTIMILLISFISYGNFAKGENSLDSDNLSIKFFENKDNYLIPNQYIIYLKDHDFNNIPVDPLLFYDQVLGETDSELLHVYNYAITGFAIKIHDSAILDLLSEHPLVKYIGQDKIIHAFASHVPQKLPLSVDRVDGDLSSINDNTGKVNADIAILDTGIDLNHDDLNVVQEMTFVPGTGTANDDHGHGTHIAGIAAAEDNDVGIVGIAAGANLWAIKVLESSGFGDISTLVKGIDYITENSDKVDVAVASLGCECESIALDQAITNAVESGITFVVASGNNGKNANTFTPANHPLVISVSAIVDSDGKCGGEGPQTPYGVDDSLASFSNYGPVIDIAAPGVDIFSTFKSNSYSTMTGTSMAAPHVAGAAALYISNNDNTSPAAVAEALKDFGSKLGDFCDGNGRGYFSNDADNSGEPLLYVGDY